MPGLTLIMLLDSQQSHLFLSRILTRPKHKQSLCCAGDLNWKDYILIYTTVMSDPHNDWNDYILYVMSDPHNDWQAARQYLVTEQKERSGNTTLNALFAALSVLDF